MAFPVVQTRSTYTNGSSLSAHAVTLPTGIVPGDRLIIACSSNGNVPPSGPPTGWRQVAYATYDGLGADRFIAVFEKVADGSEGATVTVNLSGAVPLVALGWRISAAGRPEGATATGDSANPNPPNLAPAGWAASDVLWLAITGARGTSFSVFPSGYASTRTVTAAGNYMIGSAEKSANGASEDPGTFTMTSDKWAAATIGVPPPSPGFFSFFI